MERTSGRLIASPADLVGHLACGHLTALNSEVVRDALQAPVGDDLELAIIQQRGLEHEARYLEALVAQGLSVVEIAQPDGAADRIDALRRREAETLAAMQAGVDVIFQATFLDERHDVLWRGHADFLRKVERPSELGAWSYEPEDTKLARQVKSSAILQLCHYAEQIARLQGTEPEQVHVVLGGQERASARLEEVAAYYRAAKARFLAALQDAPATYPLPTNHCGVCRWDEACSRRREADDHLCRVAGLTREQDRRLTVVGVGTFDRPGPLVRRPSGARHGCVHGDKAPTAGAAPTPQRFGFAAPRRADSTRRA